MVVINKCRSYEYNELHNALSEMFKKLGGIARFVKQGTRVVLKPNLVMKKRPEECATTHPELIRALTDLLLDAGATVTIADSPGGLYNETTLKGLYSVCGLEKISSNENVRLNYNLEVSDVQNPEGKYLKSVTVIKPLAEADLVINLPKLKTHGQMVYTGAVKNMFGAVPGVLKAEYHFRMPEYDEFANALIDIFLSVKPALNIMDAVMGMEGHGPTSGNPKQIGLLLASDNAFELDMTALAVIGVEPANVPVLRNAMLRGLCPKSIGEVCIEGVEIKDVRVENFDTPQLDSLKAVEFVKSPILRHAVARLKPKPVFNRRVCTGCTSCAKNCPAGIIEMKKGKPHVKMEKCIRCFCCQELCPAKAVSIKRSIIIELLTKKSKKI